MGHQGFGSFQPFFWRFSFAFSGTASRFFGDLSEYTMLDLFVLEGITRFRQKRVLRFEGEPSIGSACVPSIVLRAPPHVCTHHACHRGGQFR
ncbi:uncharacterized protein LACBIDRAFT_296749 [Laccaria bicolor S238N-H82]|uniref:Predicted protein n=1 Tax=Laccaria bicolor (strain S238N-H82 / ATCC MYA-4686) TaxID=486041 RepID=B0E313_LACBS|nr:uncharacterized protein LACBIDRAFT_296749 [Laccaria bicolor S238N-H82]EDQ98770.1 predicted protein [Laccaria bicolor S238N-H82]|eukprot:XP_001890576.1 predicted protein [Laccaria bicolor S238N-H82]